MRFCKTLAIVAVVALAMVGTNVAKADGAPDPKVKIVVPTDPVIEACSDVPAGVTCFTSNSDTNPVVIAGPTLAELQSPGYDFITNFIYEPDDSICNPTSCPDPAADALMTLWIEISPTIPIPLATYSCDLGTPPAGETPAFNVCPLEAGVAEPSGNQELELACVPTAGLCTGMLPGEEGSAEIAPEPGELAMLAMGIALVGFCGWKRRKAVELSRANQQNLAVC
jgi:hypothetical protein